MAVGKGSNNSGYTGGMKGHPFGARVKREQAKMHSRRSKLGKKVKGKRINRAWLK